MPVTPRTDIQSARPLGGIGNGQLQGVLQGLRDGQLGLRGGELRGEADFADQILGARDGLSGQPGRPRRGQDAEDGLHQGRLAAARGPDDGVQTPGKESGVGAVEDDGAFGARPDGEILAAQHWIVTLPQADLG